MITKEAHDDLYFIEFDESCRVPLAAGEALASWKISFPESSYSSWQATFRRHDPHEITIGFSQGTLSVYQNAALLLRKASELTGGYVKLSPKYHFCPFLVGQDEGIVPLYEFVEVLDGAVDYQQIKEAIPNLSYAQIQGSMAFLRKITQFNTSDKDIDDLEDEYLASDPEFVNELRQALADQGKPRVLNFSEPDNERAT